MKLQIVSWIVLASDGHAVWRYTCVAIVCIFVSYNFITFRGTIRWSSPMMVFAAATILLILVAALVPGISPAVEIVLLYVLGPSRALFVVSAFW